VTPGAHALASWLAAHALRLPRRERRLVTLAGVLPDLDGLGLLMDLANAARHRTTTLYDDLHHVLGHNVFAGLLLVLGVLLLARRARAWAALGALATFHLHLLADLAGSRGPDGYAWPLAYLWPARPGGALAWKGQWALDGWQNLAILAGLFLLAGLVAARRRRSFLEVVSTRLDRACFRMVDRRFLRLRGTG